LLVDKNGVEYIPIQGLTYTNESYTPHENFRPDGSYRLDFTGERDSVCIGSYMNVAGPPDEEFAGKILGTHSSKGKNSGSYVIGIQLNGKRVRLRKEIHPKYTSSIHATPLNLGDLRKKWVGIMYFKINDIPVAGQVTCRAFVDITGLDSDGHPRNNWQPIFEIVDDGTIAKGKWKPVWLKPSLGPTKTQNTLRVDEQKKSTYSYKHVFCREIVAV